MPVQVSLRGAARPHIPVPLTPVAVPLDLLDQAMKELGVTVALWDVCVRWDVGRADVHMRKMVEGPGLRRSLSFRVGCGTVVP